MTDAQKNIISFLLRDHAIALSGPNGYRLRSPEGHPVAKISGRSFDRLKINCGVLRRTKSGLWVIDKRKVRQLHGRSFIKTEYRKLYKSKSDAKKQ